MLPVKESKFQKARDTDIPIGVEADLEERIMIANRHIPEFIIKDLSGEMLKNAVGRRGSDFSHQVNLKIDLGMAHPDNHVDVELWFSTLVDFPDQLL